MSFNEKAPAHMGDWATPQAAQHGLYMQNRGAKHCCACYVHCIAICKEECNISVAQTKKKKKKQGEINYRNWHQHELHEAIEPHVRRLERTGDSPHIGSNCGHKKGTMCKVSSHQVNILPQPLLTQKPGTRCLEKYDMGDESHLRIRLQTRAPTCAHGVEK